jgi:hypothetical protein
MPLRHCLRCCFHDPDDALQITPLGMLEIKAIALQNSVYCTSQHDWHKHASMLVLLSARCSGKMCVASHQYPSRGTMTPEVQSAPSSGQAVQDAALLTAKLTRLDSQGRHWRPSRVK